MSKLKLYSFIYSNLHKIRFASLIKSTTLVFFSLIGFNALAQTCESGSGRVYISTRASTSAGSQLQSLAYSSGSTSFQPIGAEWSGGQYNAMAYNGVDHKIYASGYNAGTNSGRLLQVNPSTGAVTDLGQITGINALDGAATVGFNAGAFDGAGNYWAANGLDAAIYKIDLATRVATRLPLIGGAVDQPDFTLMGGFFWLVKSANAISRIDPNTGNVTSFTLPFSLGTSSVFGAAFTFPNQDIAFMGNETGELFRVSVSNSGSASPTFTLISTTQGPANSGNDGTICNGAPIDLSISKVASPRNVVPGGQVTWTLTVKNIDTIQSATGFVVRDVFPAGLTGLATTTPGCTISGSTLTCTEGTLTPGATFVATVQSNAPSAVGTYTNTAMVIGNDDDTNQTNNTSSDSVTVGPVVTPQPDSGSGTVGTPITPINVLTNDTTNGVASTTTNSTIAVVTPASNSGVVLDPATGMVTTTAAVPPGTYTITYRLCDKLTPATCNNTTATVTIAAAVTPQPDTGSGTAGTPITPINVLTNDTTNGVASTTTNSTIAVVTPASNPGVVLDPATGMVTTTAAVPPGTYTIAYRLCDTLTPATCATSTVTVTITAKGSVGPGNPAPVPTLSEFGMLALSGLLLLLGLPHLRRRFH